MRSTLSSCNNCQQDWYQSKLIETTPALNLQPSFHLNFTVSTSWSTLDCYQTVSMLLSQMVFNKLSSAQSVDSLYTINNADLAELLGQTPLYSELTHDLRWIYYSKLFLHSLSWLISSCFVQSGLRIMLSLIHKTRTLKCKNYFE